MDQLAQIKTWDPHIIAAESINHTLHYGVDPNSPIAELIRQNSLSFPAEGLIAMDDSGIFALSKKILQRVTAIASTNKMKVRKSDIPTLKEEGSHNGLLHELAHLRKLLELRPHLIATVTINIMLLEYNGDLGIAMNNIVPASGVPLMPVEQAQVLLAPPYPSDSDYFMLYRDIKQVPLDPQEVKEIIMLLQDKPKSEGRDYLLNAMRPLLGES